MLLAEDGDGSEVPLDAVVAGVAVGDLDAGVACPVAGGDGVDACGQPVADGCVAQIGSTKRGMGAARSRLLFVLLCLRLSRHERHTCNAVCVGAARTSQVPMSYYSLTLACVHPANLQISSNILIGRIDFGGYF